ncbi:MAG: hypothetical protein COW30_14780 [Rhodospirillales bacterium CG15_BIG_FIL_POST_REV_8_21_14_020_66_15]|nr:MAG: hypothetical protein COW30_14780 [Rhodospirillales bacterium CG15_BIG_FIL_POST_REV_8_21_14_020_66_15]
MTPTATKADPAPLSDPLHRRAQPPWLGAGLAASALLLVLAARYGEDTALLGLIGIVLGIALYHGALGFTGAYRRLFTTGDVSGVMVQLVMLAVASILFAPVLAEGQAFGRSVSGAVAPVGVSMVLGAFLFGIGMQLGGGCGSGTLFTVGGGDTRMIVTLAFFCLGGFWGSLDLAGWRTLPEVPGISLGQIWGYGPALAVQLAVLGFAYLLLKRLGRDGDRPLWPSGGFKLRSLFFGPWPLLFAGTVLAVLNWGTLVTAGHPWSITWGFTLWGAKAATLVGWDPATSGFWTGGFQARALAAPVLSDTTSVMDLGIVAGALLAAGAAGRMAPSIGIPPKHLLASVIGGLMLGYGARLAYGCNIGAFFSGVASTSLHGWVWILAALPGNWLGVKLRPYFGLSS